MKVPLSSHGMTRIHRRLLGALALLLVTGLFAFSASAQAVDPRVQEVVRKLQRHHMGHGVERSPAQHLARELEALRRTLYRVAAAAEAGAGADEAALLEAHLTQSRLYLDEMAARLPRNPNARRRQTQLESKLAELEVDVEGVLQASDPVRRAASARDLIRKIEDSRPDSGSRRLGDDLPTSRTLKPVNVIPREVQEQLRELQARRRGERAARGEERQP